MTTQASSETSSARVGRYVLEDLVTESRVGTQFWRASDPALKRAVGARLLPIDHPRAPRLREAARAAARVHLRPIVQVLDVVETDRYLAVITEWVQGRPWTEVVLGAEEADGAGLVAYEVARALQACHEMGVAHGRLRPSSIMITDTHEVRVRGLQIDAAMYGVSPGEDPFAADVHGVGAVLFAGLTGRWPDAESQGGTLDGLPIAGRVRGRFPTADELVAGVPPELSRIASACLAATDPQAAGRSIAKMDQAVAVLAEALLRAPALHHHADPVEGTRRQRPLGWFAAVAVALVMALAAAFVVGGGRAPQPPAPVASPTAPAPLAPVTVEPQPLAFASVTDFDPQGEDGRENPDLVGFATDGQPDTAWLTVPYRSSGMDPKAGTGLLLDLGMQRPIREVRLALAGSGTDVEIRVAEQLGSTHTDFELLAGAVGVGPELTIRTPTPVVTRYVLVWLTNLPFNQGAYQGGVRSVSVLG